MNPQELAQLSGPTQGGERVSPRHPFCSEVPLPKSGQRVLFKGISLASLDVLSSSNIFSSSASVPGRPSSRENSSFLCLLALYIYLESSNTYDFRFFSPNPPLSWGTQRPERQLRGSENPAEVTLSSLESALMTLGEGQPLLSKGALLSLAEEGEATH